MPPPDSLKWYLVMGCEGGVSNKWRMWKSIYIDGSLSTKSGRSCTTFWDTLVEPVQIEHRCSKSHVVDLSESAPKSPFPTWMHLYIVYLHGHWVYDILQVPITDAYQALTLTVTSYWAGESRKLKWMSRSGYHL